MQVSYFILGENKSTLKGLKDILSNIPELYFLGNACTYEQGTSILLKLRPKVIFLDLDPHFEEFAQGCKDYQKMREQLKEESIFIALSTDQAMAYWALKNKFYDYFLKPFQETEIHNSLSRYIMREWSFSAQTMCLKSYKEYTLLQYDRILFFKADNNGTDINLTGGKIIRVYKSLTSFEGVLPENFARIHYSYIVNKNHIFKISFGRAKCFLKNMITPLPISASYRHNLHSLEELLEKLALTFD